MVWYPKQWLRACPEYTARCNFPFPPSLHIVIFVQSMKQMKFGKGDPFSRIAAAYNYALSSSKSMRKVVRKFPWAPIKHSICSQNIALILLALMSNTWSRSYHLHGVARVQSTKQNVVMLSQRYLFCHFYPFQLIRVAMGGISLFLKWNSVSASCSMYEFKLKVVLAICICFRMILVTWKLDL